MADGGVLGSGHMGQEISENFRIDAAGYARFIGRLVYLHPVLRGDLIKGDDMDAVGIDKGSIDIKQQAGFRRGQQILGLSVNVKAEVFIQTG